jgi:hypothetical protein
MLLASPLSGAKRTSLIGWPKSANDPKETLLPRIFQNSNLRRSAYEGASVFR